MKDVNNLNGIHSFNTKRRSIPRIETSIYLDLYILYKEKERLLKEDKRRCMRRETIKSRLQEINLEMNKLRCNDTRAFSDKKDDFSEVKSWKKLSLGY